MLRTESLSLHCYIGLLTLNLTEHLNSFFWLRLGHWAESLASHWPPTQRPFACKQWKCCPGNVAEVSWKWSMKPAGPICASPIDRERRLYPHCPVLCAALLRWLLHAHRSQGPPRPCSLCCTLCPQLQPLPPPQPLLFKTRKLECWKSWAILKGFVLTDHRALLLDCRSNMNWGGVGWTFFPFKQKEETHCFLSLRIRQCVILLPWCPFFIIFMNGCFPS